MPRKARLDAPGALHHIMVRGIDKTNVFADHQDKARFWERLGENIAEGKCSIYAWVLMDNHVHLLFKSGKHGISAVMRKLLTWYAQYFNHRHKRTGHLFQNRYKSILCDEENYLLALVLSGRSYLRCVVAPETTRGTQLHPLRSAFDIDLEVPSRHEFACSYPTPFAPSTL